MQNRIKSGLEISQKVGSNLGFSNSDWPWIDQENSSVLFIGNNSVAGVSGRKAAQQNSQDGMFTLGSYNSILI